MDTHLDPSDLDPFGANQGLRIIFTGTRVSWTSPELIDWDYRPTKESDVYALGMVIYEVRIFAYMRP